MEKHRDIVMEGQGDCGVERKTKGWRDRGMEKHRDIVMEGQRDCGMEGQRNGETQGHSVGGTGGLWGGEKD